LKQKEAINELIKCLSQKINWKPKDHKAQPRWIASIILLGYLCAEESLPSLIDILHSSDLDTSTALFILRTIENICDHTIEKGKYAGMIKQAINFILGKLDLGKNWQLQSSSGQKPMIIDIDWYIKILCGIILIKLGDFSGYNILEKTFNSAPYASAKYFISQYIFKI
jgi:hypothetical protein